MDEPREPITESSDLPDSLAGAVGAPPITLHGLIKAAHELRSATPPSFDTALLCVSNCLTEAEHWTSCGAVQRARQLYRLAEFCAICSGYLELIRLVWAYDIPDIPPVIGPW